MIIDHLGAKTALYDTQTDPQEMIDVSEANRDIGEHLKQRINKFKKNTKVESVEVPVRILSEQDKEKLKALGYL